jgi:8-oxo-dGTP pyrophosphatase MutT (NUDIX family)
MAAIRETFEESGILLAKNKRTGELLAVDEKERERARKAVHDGTVTFPTWLAEQGGVADIGSLLSSSLARF